MVQMSFSFSAVPISPAIAAVISPPHTTSIRHRRKSCWLIWLMARCSSGTSALRYCGKLSFGQMGTYQAPAVQILYLILSAPSVRNEFCRERRYYLEYIFFHFYNSLFKRAALLRAARSCFCCFAASAQSRPSPGGSFTVTVYSFE